MTFENIKKMRIKLKIEKKGFPTHKLKSDSSATDSLSELAILASSGICLISENKISCRSTFLGSNCNFGKVSQERYNFINSWRFDGFSGFLSFSGFLGWFCSSVDF